MFGIGMPEMLLILAIALIVIGPQKLPDLAKSLGKAFAEFRRATSEIKESLDIEDNDLKEIRASFDDMREELKGAVDIKEEEEPNGKDDSPKDGNVRDTKPDNRESEGPITDG